MSDQMMEDNSKGARLRKDAALREHLEHLPPGSLFNTSMAAIYLSVSTKTMARMRKVKNLGPPYIEPAVAEGVERTTQPVKYRKSELDIYLTRRISLGGFDFASQVEPWLVNAHGAIEGSALGLSIEELLESEPLVATLLDAMVEPWASAAAMAPYRNELDAALRQVMAQVDSNLQTLQMEERTEQATGKPRRGGL
jgi:hypothetical protein